MKFKLSSPHLSHPVRTIGVVSPASRPLDGTIEPAIEILKSNGFKIEVSNQVYADGKWTAGDDNTRIKALNQYLSDSNIDCIWASRGGYGTPRIADKLVTTKNQKVIIGYSDITYLLIAMSKNRNLNLVHGPMVSELTNAEKKEGNNLILDYLKGNDISEVLSNKFNENISILRQGNFNGELIGGNLTCIQNLIGTKNIKRLKGKVLFLEEVGEKMYSLDRTLQHLSRSGIFKHISGLILGGIYRPDEPSNFTDDDLYESVLDATQKWQTPILSGLPIGHGFINYPIPFGTRIKKED